NLLGGLHFGKPRPDLSLPNRDGYSYEGASGRSCQWLAVLGAEEASMARTFEAHGVWIEVNGTGEGSAILIEGGKLTWTESHQDARVIFSRISEEFARPDRYFIDACDGYI